MTEQARAGVAPLAGSQMPLSADAGFGVYVHWPFCAARCPYCDFNVHVRHDGVDQTVFRKAFATEIATSARETGPRVVDSVFFGGGTPSLMEPETVGAILEAVARHWTLSDAAEVTLEANPTSVEADRFAGYRDAGVNRVSLGIQSLRDEDLRALGRRHTVSEAIAALRLATRLFDRVTFDLIYARPGQTLADWEAELAEALNLAVGHLSLYQLTMEPGTPFARRHERGQLIIPEPEEADALYDLSASLTTEAGLPLYEISNHARPSEESRHNLIYWRYGEYVGLGPGAHGRPIIDGRRIGTEVERHPERWAERVAAHGHGRVVEDPVKPDQAADEMLLMGLRLAEGVDLARLRALAGVEIDPERIAELVLLGLVETVGSDRLRASPSGRFVLNRLVLELSDGFRQVTQPA